jgi:hypothetical protein
MVHQVTGRRQVAETRDVMIRSFPVRSHKQAKVAAGARRIALGEYLGKLVDMHSRLVWYAEHNSENGRRARKVLEEFELEGVRA